MNQLMKVSLTVCVTVVVLGSWCWLRRGAHQDFTKHRGGFENAELAMLEMLNRAVYN